jgi:hypothetical protein
VRPERVVKVGLFVTVRPLTETGFEGAYEEYTEGKWLGERVGTWLG